ncbi:MAG: copper amine oxidase N-terminal domain-containing protein, partial [Bacillota bacterium]
NLKYITPAYSETAAETKVDVYKEKRLVKSVVFAIGINEYYVDGKTPGTKMDARPFIKDGRTFVPVRFLGSALGVTDDNITWDSGQRKVTLKLGQNTVEMVIGVPRITVNGQNKDIDAAPILNEAEGRTYLPARYIAEGLGFEVGWDETAGTVSCWPKGEAQPDVGAVKQYISSMKKPVPAQNPAMPPNLLPTDNSEGKPEEVKQLELQLGIMTGPYSSYWSYAPIYEKMTWDEDIWREANKNNGRSYFTFEYYTDDGGIIATINWIRNLSDIRDVKMDLSPMEKVLNWRFPDHPETVQEMMTYAWQVAEKTRASDGTERAPWKDYNINGWKVSIGSIGGCFVEALINKEGD